MLIKLSKGAALAASVLMLTACSDSGTDADTDAVQALQASADAPAADATEADASLLNIVDTAVNAEIFTTLVAALQATELDTVLADESKTYTVFAPTDTAFEALGSDTINALLADTETLSDILLYHVFPDAAVNAETAVSLAGTMITMANGDEVALTLDRSNLFINQSRVTVTDVMASNGIIHVIDMVLTPQADDVETVDAPQLNIVETAVAAGTFNTLAAALTATGLIDTLSNVDDQFTVFAPTDDAFAALPEGTVEALLADPETLKDILLYHVIGGSAIDSTTAISLAGESVTMANGDELAVSLVDGALLVNDSTVTATDIRTSNGIIHVIDTVLLPPTEMAAEPVVDAPVDAVPEAPTGTILEIAQSNPDFSTLVAAVDAAGLAGALGHPGDTYTVFAPTNAAFAALGSDTINALLADPETLRNILLLHVLPGTVVDAETALSLVGFDIQAGNGETLSLTLEGDALLINGATIIATDIQAVNGVIHVIDAVLLPSS